MRILLTLGLTFCLNHPILAKAVEKEKSIDCKWTVGRILKLQKTIRAGGKGSSSKFCQEYKKRLSELKEKNCKNKAARMRAGFC